MKKIFILIIVLFTIESCTDLSIDMEDRLLESEFPENTAQIPIALSPMYAPLPEFLDNGGWWFCQEVTSDEMVCPTRNADWDDGGKWRALYTHSWNNSTEAIAGMWDRLTKGVVNSNKVREQFFSKASGTPSGNEAIAKLNIMRSYYYYLLIDNFGDVPYTTSFFNAEKEPKKISKAAIFDSITNNIKNNIKYLSPSESKFAVTKQMAFCLLAKLYINAEVYSGASMWNEAEIWCDSVINLKKYTLESDPLSPFVTKNENSTENIFTIPYDEDLNKGFNLHMRTLNYLSNKTYDMTVGPWNGFAVTYDHYKTYEDVDKRKKGFLVGQQHSFDGKDLFDETANSPLIIDPVIPALKMDASFTLEQIRMSGARVVKFEIKIGAKENLSNDFPLFRYADILLMKAECMIRQGKNGDEYVNMIRTRAGVANIVNCTIDQILEERGREMFWEAHRRQDLIRFDKFTKAWWEKPADNPGTKTFPIPKSAVDANPNLAN